MAETGRTAKTASGEWLAEVREGRREVWLGGVDIRRMVQADGAGGGTHPNDFKDFKVVRVSVRQSR